jgi:LDH2 family malate/lactate/ureidoglycolate dehydrogenase
MRLSIGEARALVHDLMLGLDHTPEEADIITDHIIDCELRGLSFGGLPRALSVVEKIRGAVDARKPIAVVRDSPVSALIDGGGQVGYVVGHRATSLAIEKAKQQGLGVVGAFNTWYTGMFAHYMEMATNADLVAMAAGSSAWRVAPFGSSEGRFGTNPIAFGFPSTAAPIILDFATSSVMVSEAILRKRLTQPLPTSVAYDTNGNPTRDPAAALNGAFTVWGGHKGSGLAIAIQLFGLLCNSALIPPEQSDCCLFILVMRPDLLVPLDEFKGQVAEYAKAVRDARAIDLAQPVRMPFDRSAAERKRRLEENWIDVPEPVYTELVALRSQME